MEHKIFSMTFGSVYPHYVNKAQKKGRTEEEVRELITWLTGYSKEDFIDICTNGTTIKAFFNQAPKMNENRDFITGSICGIKVQDIEDPLMKNVRQLDKIIDELAKGKALDKIKR